MSGRAWVGVLPQGVHDIETPETGELWARAEVMWRSPIFHAIKTYDPHPHLVTHDTDGTEFTGQEGCWPYVQAPWADWECGGTTIGILPEAIVETIPPGYEPCERCAVIVNRRLHAAIEKVHPDRARHLTRTQNLLNA